MRIFACILAYADIVEQKRRTQYIVYSEYMNEGAYIIGHCHQMTAPFFVQCIVLQKKVPYFAWNVKKILAKSVLFMVKYQRIDW